MSVCFKHLIPSLGGVGASCPQCHDWDLTTRETTYGDDELEELFELSDELEWCDKVGDGFEASRAECCCSLLLLLLVKGSGVEAVDGLALGFVVTFDATPKLLVVGMPEDVEQTPPSCEEEVNGDQGDLPPNSSKTDAVCSKMLSAWAAVVGGPLISPEVGLQLDEPKLSNGDQTRLSFPGAAVFGPMVLLLLLAESILVGDGFNRDEYAFDARLALFGGEGHLVVEVVAVLLSISLLFTFEV